MVDDDEQEDMVMAHPKASDDEPSNNSADSCDEEPAPKKSRKNKATSDKKVSACELEHHIVPVLSSIHPLAGRCCTCH